MKVLTTLATGLLLSFFSGTALADANNNFAGTKLKVSWPALGHFNNAEEVIEGFERQTGIIVEVEALPYLNLRNRHIEELSRPKGDLDLVSWVVMWKGEYVANGYLEPLQQYFENPALADENYAIDDISKPYLVSGGMVGGPKGYLDGPGATLYGIPFGAETSIVAYRKDIFAQHGLTPPNTYDELETAIRQLAIAGIPAMSSRGKGASNLTFAWLLHLGPFGGTVFDNNWEPQINQKEAVEAAEFLRLVAQTGPEDMDTFSFGQSAFAFLSGDAAIYLDNFKIAAAARNIVSPEFLENIGYLRHPTGRSCSAETGGFAMGIPANSQNKEAAFLLLQYLTSQEGDLRVAQAGGDPARISTFAKTQRERPESSAIVGSLLCADTDWRPLIPEWPAIQNTVLGPTLVQVTQTDRPVQEIMDEAAIELRSLMEEAGYYSEN